jgi:methionyl-tRNA formyltransferase
MRVVFFGTPAFAERSLARLVESRHRVVAVVTRADRPRGRGQKVLPGPVKAYADSHAIPVLQPERIRDEAFTREIAAMNADLGVVAAYGKILPQSLIDAPSLGTINVHASLLPRWRGAAPVHRAILAGDTETGVTIMRVVQALDAGPMLALRRTAIGPDETSADLELRLASIGAELLVETIDAMEAGPLAETPQPETGVTYAARLEKQDSRVDWSRPAAVIHNQIRGLQPWPLASVVLNERRLLLLGSEVAGGVSARVEPGTVASVDAAGIAVAAATGTVRITRLKLEGKPAISARDFLNGHRVAPGDRMEPLPVDQ